ncbi:MAG: hypothetical protein HQK52_19425 [Oligoflexia bacterium]|nr:hypothetical protein [Oligoflexia bacterium]
MKNRVRGSLFQIKFSDSDLNEVPEKIQILRVGNFTNEFTGEVFSITPDTLKSMVDNFKINSRGIDLGIDVSHRPEDGYIAWITELSLEDNGNELWAVVRWTQPGKDLVKNKTFRYVSADFNYNYRDNESLKEFGPTLNGAALTNRPFVKNMEPIIQLTEDINRTEDGKMSEELKKELEQLKTQMAALMKENVEIKQNQQFSERKYKFDKLFMEGKACEAQREAFMIGDMDKFSELATPYNSKNVGHSKEPSPKNVKASENVEDEVLKAAREKSKSMDIPLHDAISVVFKEDKELASRFHEFKKNRPSEQGGVQ